jgi:hypothetical protein
VASRDGAGGRFPTGPCQGETPGGHSAAAARCPGAVPRGRSRGWCWQLVGKRPGALHGGDPAPAPRGIWPAPVRRPVPCRDLEQGRGGGPSSPAATLSGWSFTEYHCPRGVTGLRLPSHPFECSYCDHRVDSGES